MILLDTNVVSELMARSPDGSVVSWVDRQPTEELHLTTVTIAEILYGLHALPEGRRRRSLEVRFRRFVERGFELRVVTFDLAAAHLYGEIMAGRRRRGRPMSMADGQIAAIARANDAVVATRNVRDFEGCGVQIVNPFEPPG